MLLGQLKRVIKKHGGQTEAKTSIFKGLLLNNGSTLGAVNSLMDFIFDAKETDKCGKNDKNAQFTKLLWYISQHTILSSFKIKTKCSASLSLQFSSLFVRFPTME